MVISFGAAGLCHAIMATYTYISTSTDINVQPFTWVPVVAFSSMIFIAACGALPVPYVVMGEILPDKVSATEKRNRMHWNSLRNDSILFQNSI